MYLVTRAGVGTGQYLASEVARLVRHYSLREGAGHTVQDWDPCAVGCLPTFHGTRGLPAKYVTSQVLVNLVSEPCRQPSLETSLDLGLLDIYAVLA